MKQLCLIALVFALLACPSNAHADVAPPMYPPGSNLQPGAEITQVRMVAETVVIAVQKDTISRSLGQARVTADFSMRNLGTVDESMAVRFPITVNNGRGDYPEIDNIAITVDGNQVRHRRANYPDFQTWSDEDVPWAEFDVTFPGGEEVLIRVTYDLEGTGYYPYTVFYYILETGAGWKDTIGSADVILRFPYEASPQNFLMDMGTGWGTTTPGGVFQGNEVRWHFEDFEPGPDQPVKNMEFALVAPSAWQAVMDARENVSKYPKDGETWGMLGKAYKQVFQMNKGYREDDGGQELYRLSVEAYETCLSLDPKDAQWHAGFADLLANRAMWDAWAFGVTPEAIRALEEIHTALELAPNDPVVREVAQEISYMLQDGMKQNGSDFDFPWLTQTPTAIPPTLVLVLETSPAQTATQVAPVETSATASPSVAVNPTRGDSPQAEAEPAPRRPIPICGSVIFAPLVLIAWFLRKRG